MDSRLIKQVRQYKLRKILGQGSFATVFLGENPKKEIFAIKEIKLEEDDGSEEVQKLHQYFEQEIEIYLKTKHANLVSMIEEFTEKQFRYCVFEYCANGDLNNFWKNNLLTEQEAKTIFTQILAGMKYLAEQSIVHRDLKLDNILIDEKNTIKIADFGFAKYYNSEDIFVSYCGTPATMAPEILNKQSYDFKCDIWSLGVILYQLIFKKYHWKGNVRSILDLQKQLQQYKVEFDNQVKLSDEGKDLISKMLVSDKEKRINYQQLFAHPWLEGKLDESQNLLESQWLIQSKLTTKQPGQIIGNIIKQQRRVKADFCQILDHCIKDSRKEEVKEKFKNFRKQVNQEKFNITINSNNLIDKPEFELFDYTCELYEFLSNLYDQYEMNYRETAKKELELIQFLKENPLSNSITFNFDGLNTLEQIKVVRNSIVEEDINDFEDPQNWQIDTIEIDEFKRDVVDLVIHDRFKLNKLDQMYSYHVSQSNNILNKN
ncbi:unnamed protein product (macronuclear) [Paramecium tetraurelia]|uniref:Protein kinase domain-containing protein n=1 Tax=Paramecium tetraurelia TaxID=5888 RepID=A0BM29_PARTE|nr:uncharacterized protein GSPATT00030230001 [Paramecium tetraurelia]CAK59596.1 unnamed protein product [Paramecium tetraurelia]|eukprot:XP_001426994.1 hypothetical protein (macronuclear) [Paramecium tetraurelia strain d4-2]